MLDGTGFCLLDRCTAGDLDIVAFTHMMCSKFVGDDECHDRRYGLVGDQAELFTEVRSNRLSILMNFGLEGELRDDGREFARLGGRVEEHLRAQAGPKRRGALHFVWPRQ